MVWCFAKQPGETIGVNELETGRPPLRAGDILAIDTGWSAQLGTDNYDFHPSFTEATADWLVERRIKMLACDFATPDLVACLASIGRCIASCSPAAS